VNPLELALYNSSNLWGQLKFLEKFLNIILITTIILYTISLIIGVSQSFIALLEANPLILEANNQ
jgi:hypothetical protein